MSSCDDDPPRLERENSHNWLVDLKSGRIVLELLGPAGHPSCARDNPTATWSGDSASLFWQVDGKWAPRSLLHIWIEPSGRARQVDLRTAACKEILRRTREGLPMAYAKIVDEGRWGSQPPCPDGFAFSITVDPEAASLPLRFVAELNSSPRDGPMRATFVSTCLTGVLQKNHVIEWQEFGVFVEDSLRGEFDRVEEELLGEVAGYRRRLSPAKVKGFDAEQELWEKEHSYRADAENDLPLPLSNRWHVKMMWRLAAARERLAELKQRSFSAR